MSTAQAPERERLLTIGTVCRRLQAEFPDISISKIRYLEDQGLLAPRRTQSGYRLSFALFGADLPASGRRFAIAETLSHLERLVNEGAARREEGDGAVTYTAA